LPFRLRERGFLSSANALLQFAPTTEQVQAGPGEERSYQI